MYDRGGAVYERGGAVYERGGAPPAGKPDKRRGKATNTKKALREAAAAAGAPGASVAMVGPVVAADDAAGGRLPSRREHRRSNEVHAPPSMLNKGDGHWKFQLDGSASPPLSHAGSEENGSAPGPRRRKGSKGPLELTKDVTHALDHALHQTAQSLTPQRMRRTLKDLGSGHSAIPRYIKAEDVTSGASVASGRDSPLASDSSLAQFRA